MANAMMPWALQHCIKHVHARTAIGLAIQQTRQYSAPASRAIPEAKQKFVPSSGVYPQGFRTGTSHAGVKASNTKYDDVALIVSDTPCAAAAVTTRNIFKAAPVVYTRDTLAATRGQNLRGVVINSGCANAVTGKVGAQSAETMAKTADQCLDGYDKTSSVSRMLVMSTGVIGQQLPMSRIEPAIPKAHQALGKTHDHWLRAAQAICTTDTFPKLISREFNLPSHPETTYRIAGMTKGAGMIHPNMGTLLGVICTDAAVDSKSLATLVRLANKSSFNSISIDGDTSTNDTVCVFANGAAAPQEQKALTFSAGTNSETDDGAFFSRVLTSFMQELAQLVVRDGEGATKFVTIRLQHTPGAAEDIARRAAASIATSPLVKTALYGKDANWGRILCAIGNAPGLMWRSYLDSDSEEASFDQLVKPELTSVSFRPSDGSEDLKLLVRGEPQTVDEERAKIILEMEDLEIVVNLNDEAGGKAELHDTLFWTCDMSHEYVTINGDYRT